MKLYLIRHGESEGNSLGRIQGQEEYHLTDNGRKQAELVGRYIKEKHITHLYSSDLIRAWDTASIISNHIDVKPVKAQDVREIHLGPLQNLTRTEIYEKYPDVIETSIILSGIEGTESAESITNRCSHFLSEMLQKHMNEHVAVVSHGGFLSIFLMYIIVGEQWPRHKRPFQLSNTSVTSIEWREGKYSPLIHYTNKTDHLLMNETSSKGLL
ncbi:histidine phosphatase family protein [Halalkalibacter hemicellulosilyticus]|uniref:Phosphoglycerate mutase n=1 Tax=Halalkalibacter hemicellulosilyticusJCM 9152 TaxID=1236971 RepID=W4QGA1_9BACI|nr:histidine phosphatase family protein [Halalkalibacter hemicellulosilyticus]GAE31116.1 phosphoglycerate mutase [Halalkalibacter hemicellulosilyticusJCM 9152]